MRQLSKETLQKMTRRELSDYCKQNNIRGWSGKTKAERVKLILKYSKPKKQGGKKQSIKKPKIHKTKKLEKELKMFKEIQKIPKGIDLEIRNEYIQEIYEKYEPKKSKPRMTKIELLEVLEEDLKDWRPSGRYSVKRKIEVNKNNGTVEIDYRDLGNWDMPYEDAEYRWLDYSRYINEFEKWAETKKWDTKVKNSVMIQEKRWVTFELGIFKK